MSKKLTLTQRFQKGGWLPSDPKSLEKWLVGLKKRTTAKTGYGLPGELDLLPSVREFKESIESDGEMFMGFHQMFKDAVEPFPLDYMQLVAMLNDILQKAPFYGDLGPPIFMILNRAMNTQGGYTTFLNPKVNLQFQNMFKDWTKFLYTEASTNVLTTDEGGWFSPAALKAMDEHFQLGFENTFKCNSKAPHWGFTSWDNFFNREFLDGVRSVQFPDRDDIISAACESKLLGIAKKVEETDTFWLKDYPYSVRHLLNNDEYADQFIGGTIFQGFLEVTGYHRWHAPVTGTVKKVVHVVGTFFVQAPDLIGQAGYPYLDGLPFITSITARALIFIESDNPFVGLMCFVALGMTEISSCEVTVTEGQKVVRGDQLGMFHFGGSSHCLVFRPQTILEFFDDYDEKDEHVKVRAAIAGVIV